MIVHRNGKWYIKTNSGKLLGPYPSDLAAKKRERQIVFFKNLKAGKIPDSVLKKKSLRGK